MSRRGGTAVMVGILLLSACGSDTPYFSEPDTTRITAGAAPDEVVYIGIAYLSAHAGDEVVLRSAEPLDAVSGAEALTWYASPLNAVTGAGSIGAVGADHPAVANLVPLSGTTVPASGKETIEVVVGVRAHGEERIAFDSVRLSFLVNGRETSQVFPAGMTVCVANPRPTSCA